MGSNDDKVTKLQTAGTCSFIGQGIMARVVIKASFRYLAGMYRFILDAEPKMVLKCNDKTKDFEWRTVKQIIYEQDWHSSATEGTKLLEASVELSHLVTTGCFNLMKQAELMAMDLRRLCDAEPVVEKSPSIQGTVTQNRQTCYIKRNSQTKTVKVKPDSQSNLILVDIILGLL